MNDLTEIILKSPRRVGWITEQDRLASRLLWLIYDTVHGAASDLTYQDLGYHLEQE